MYVLHAAEGVGQQPVGRQGDGVHGEVAAAEIRVEVAHEADGLRVAVVGIASVRAEGRDLHRAGIHADGDGAVLYAGGAGVGEDIEHLRGEGAGAHIPVLRMDAQQDIPHAAAHKVCQVAARLKSHKHLTDVFRRGDSCHAECSYADNIKY